MMTVRRGIIQGACLAVFAVLSAACTPESETDAYTGYVEAEFIHIAAPASGWLTNAPPEVGETISIGQTLFILDQDLQKAQQREAASRLAQADAQARNLETGARDPEIEELQAQRDEAAAALNLARTERHRIAQLVDQDVLPQSRLDTAVAEEKTAAARVRALERRIDVAGLAGREAERQAASAASDAASAVLDQATWHLNQRRVLARRGGRVEEIFFRIGEFVPAGTPVLSVLPPDALKIRFFVPQKDLSLIAVEDEILVQIDGLPEPVPARISFIARDAEFTPPVIFSAASREKLVFMVEARLPDASALRPGQPVDVILPERTGP